jgi:hypothetical protein
MAILLTRPSGGTSWTWVLCVRKSAKSAASSISGTSAKAIVLLTGGSGSKRLVVRFHLLKSGPEPASTSKYVSSNRDRSRASSVALSLR